MENESFGDFYVYGYSFGSDVTGDVLFDGKRS